MRLLAERRVTQRHLTPLYGNPPLTDMWFWVRAQDLTTTPVATWPDISGNGNNFTQATGGNQPALTDNGPGGYPAVLFDGSSDWLGSSLDSEQPLTLAGVASRVAAEGSIIGGRNPSATTQPGALVYITGSNYTMFAGSNAQSAVSQTVPWLRFATSFNGSSSRRYFNEAIATVNPGTRGCGLVTLGAHISTGTTRTNFWNGYIAEAVGWTRALSDSELSQVMDYFAAKYNL